MQKYYNPRLHNAVVAGTGMEHPRRPHVVLGSELNGYVQGDLVDANGICDLIHEKNVDTLAKLEALETSLKNESKARVEGMDNLSAQIDRTIANKLGSTETVYGESIQRAAEDERLQSQINNLDSKYTALGNSLSTLNTTVNGKQDALVAGNNIKNISDGTNTVSLLGAGDIRFKTINGQSILGDEDIPVAAGDDSAPYQAVIKVAREQQSSSWKPTLVKGDFNTTKNKITAGEYIDIRIYQWEVLSGAEADTIIFTELYPEDGIGLTGDEITIPLFLNNRSKSLFWNETSLYFGEDPN